MEKIPALVGFQVTLLCRAATSMSGLSVAEWKQEGGRQKEGIQVKSKKKALILQRGNPCGYRELPVLRRVRISARVNGDHLLRKPE